jgi:hypothetical protein
VGDTRRATGRAAALVDVTPLGGGFFQLVWAACVPGALQLTVGDTVGDTGRDTGRAAALVDVTPLGGGFFSLVWAACVPGALQLLTQWETQAETQAERRRWWT